MTMPMPSPSMSIETDVVIVVVDADTRDNSPRPSVARAPTAIRLRRQNGTVQRRGRLLVGQRLDTTSCPETIEAVNIPTIIGSICNPEEVGLTPFTTCRNTGR